MSRQITAAASNAVTGSNHRVAYLVSIETDSGFLRATNAPESITAFGEVFDAAAALGFTGIRETPQRQAQKLTIELEGVNPARIASLLTTKTAHRIADVYVAQFDSDYKLIADPTLLFRGYLNGQHTVTTTTDNNGVRYAIVAYEVESPKSQLERRNGIRIDILSHQARHSGDTIMRHAVADNSAAIVAWGNLFIASGPNIGDGYETDLEYWGP